MNLLDARTIHQGEMIIGVRIPRPVDLERPLDCPALALRKSASMQAEFVAELRNRVEGAGDQARHPRGRSLAGDEQQRKTRAGFLIGDANGAFFVELGRSLPDLLSGKHLRRCSHRALRRRLSACCACLRQSSASSLIVVLFGNGDRDADAIFGADGARDVTLAGRVFREFDVARSDLQRLSSRQHQLRAAAQRDDVLTA